MVIPLTCFVDAHDSMHDDLHHHHSSTSFLLNSIMTYKWLTPPNDDSMKAKTSAHMESLSKAYGKAVNAEMSNLFNVRTGMSSSIWTYKNSAVADSMEDTVKFLNFLTNFWWLHQKIGAGNMIHSDINTDPLALWLQQALIKKISGSSWNGNEVLREWKKFVDMICDVLATNSLTDATLRKEFWDAKVPKNTNIEELRAFLMRLQEPISGVPAQTAAEGVLPFEDVAIVRDVAIGCYGYLNGETPARQDKCDTRNACDFL